ncbi:restriction endonuclease subunit S [Streptomyces sp. NPDC005803]|uniref:restriction endonuclease subunit S n=1 Tax=Streptomyces sp. NPDC005803 TaxID=3154297 RepID=UPI0033EDB673
MSEWPRVALGDLCTVAAGGTPARANPDHYGGAIPWVKIGDMRQGCITATDESITEVGIKNSSAKILPAGTVLISIFATIGRTAVLGVDAATNQAIAGLTPHDPEQLSPAFLRRFLDSIVSMLEGKAQGVAQVNINSTILRALEVPVPPMREQQRMLRLLDHVDALRAKRRKAVALLDDLTRSTFLEMFGTRDQSWPCVTVNDVAKAVKGSIRTGPFGSQLLREEFVDSGVPVLGIDNAVTNEFAWQGRRFITGEKYEKLARYRVYPGDVLITIMGTCGRCVVVPDDIPVAINTKHLCCITLDQSKCLPEFLRSYFLLHPESQRYLHRTAKGAIMKGLNMAIIKDLPVSLPPISKQRAFVEKIESVKRVRSSNMAHLAELDALFASLQYRAFRGELWAENLTLNA